VTIHQRHRGSAATPWSPTDLAVCSLLVAVGISMGFVGWYDAAGKLVESEQVAPLNFAGAGTLVAGAGLVLWFLRGRRAIRHRRVGLVNHRRGLLRPTVVESISAGGTLEPRSRSAVLVSGDGLGRYHRADCPLAAGRNWRSAPRAQFEQAGRRPCGVCRP